MVPYSEMQRGDDIDVLGLEDDAVRLHDYNPRWGELYETEVPVIKAALGALLLDVQHFGSTSVPGMKAKPILDILVGIERLSDGPLCMEPLQSIGYSYLPHIEISGDYAFGKGVVRTHLLHVVQFGGPNWVVNLKFRDALRSDPSAASEYQALKVSLAARLANSRAEYTRSKADLIQRIINRP